MILVDENLLPPLRVTSTARRSKWNTLRSNNGTSRNVKLITEAALTHTARDNKNSNCMHARAVTRLVTLYNNADGTPARTPHIRTFLFRQVRPKRIPFRSFVSIATQFAHTHTLASTAMCSDESLSLKYRFSLPPLILVLLVKTFFLLSFFDSFRFRLFVRVRLHVRLCSRSYWIAVGRHIASAWSWF